MGAEHEKCDVETTLELIDGKWKGVALFHLLDNTLRFNELHRRTPAVTQRVLTKQLRELERDGLVKRHAIATVPVTVEYSITPLGMTLAKAVDPLRHWAETHLKDVQASQRRYDGTQKDAA